MKIVYIWLDVSWYEGWKFCSVLLGQVMREINNDIKSYSSPAGFVYILKENHEVKSRKQKRAKNQ